MRRSAAVAGLVTLLGRPVAARRQAPARGAAGRQGAFGAGRIGGRQRAAAAAASTSIEDRLAYLRWLGAMSEKLKKRKSEHALRVEFLEAVWYESKRAGLEPALVLGLIQVESGFRKYAISVGRRARLHAGDAVLGAHHRQWRCEPAVPHADQPALRLRHPAPLPRHREGRPVPGAGPLQRQPRPRRVSERGLRQPAPLAGRGRLRWPPRARYRAADQPARSPSQRCGAAPGMPSVCSTRSTVSATISSMLCGRW